MDRGLWCSSVMECLPRITKALNSMHSATGKKEEEDEKRKEERGMLHQTWACRISGRHWSRGEETLQTESTRGFKNQPTPIYEVQGVKNRALVEGRWGWERKMLWTVTKVAKKE